MATAELQHNFSDCRDGWKSCDQSQLTDQQVREVTVFDHQRNVSACENDWESCDNSKLDAV